MKHSIVITYLLVAFSSTLLQAQLCSISGSLTFLKNAAPIDSMQLELYNSEEALIQTTMSIAGMYSFGDLEPGEYIIQHSNYDLGVSRITSIVLRPGENLDIPIKVKDPCKEDTSEGVCQVCNSRKHVLKIKPGMIVNYNFGGNERALEKLWKKHQRLGYVTHVMPNGEKVVRSIFLESESEKFYDSCYNWFCTKNKIVF